MFDIFSETTHTHGHTNTHPQKRTKHSCINTQKHLYDV